MTLLISQTEYDRVSLECKTPEELKSAIGDITLVPSSIVPVGMVGIIGPDGSLEAVKRWEDL